MKIIFIFRWIVGHIVNQISFGILARKYMGWYTMAKINPIGCVCYKQLTNKQLHTFRGMIKYFLKDIGLEHFQVAMHNVLDDDIVEGKTTHEIFGRSNLKQCVVLTHKNVINLMFV